MFRPAELRSTALAAAELEAIIRRRRRHRVTR